MPPSRRANLAHADKPFAGGSRALHSSALRECSDRDRMEAYAGEWIQLLIRWVHLITGIAWIGASFYFVWLDNHLRAPRIASDAPDAVGGELWAIHGGGFYHVQKYRVAPPELPPTLYWFKWEAYSTWLSGFALLVAMYWWHADLFLVDRNVAAIGASTASTLTTLSSSTAMEVRSPERST